MTEYKGQRCVWTTNKSPPQKYFDPAFLRPGRMDMIIELGRCNHEGIDYLLRSYYEDFDNEDNDEKEEEKYDEKPNPNDINDTDFLYFDIKKIKLDLTGIDENRFTPAQIKQICKESANLKNASFLLISSSSSGICTEF